MGPDSTTILLSATVQMSFVGVVQLWVWLRDRSLSELGLWGTGHLVAGAGLVMLTARGVLPQRLSVDGANALILLGGALLWMGARRFERRPTSWATTLAGAVIWLILCRVPVFYHSLAHRVAFTAGALATYAFFGMSEFLRPHRPASPPSRHALAVLFGMQGVMHVGRLVISESFGFKESMFSLPNSYWYGWPTLVSITIVTAASVLQLAVAKEGAEQRSNAVLAQARDAANRANLAKSRFLARMSHELRTPLNSVLGMAQVLTRDPTLRGTQRERAVVMEQSGRHLLAIINDILDLASVEAGQFQLAPLPALVIDIVQGSIDLVAETAAVRRTRLEVTHESDVPEVVQADPLRVRQILVNLLGNAIKFTPQGGEVRLHVSRLSMAGGLRLAVSDTGPGVAADFQPHLFQDWAQRPIGADQPDSTGLGLSISASLARAMGGAIRYQPGAGGQGSVFIAELPLATSGQPVAPPVKPAGMTPPAGPLSVLVVDDVVSNRRLAEAMLRQAGFTVRLAADGPAALAEMQGELLPDIVLMDVYMPGMDGLTTTRLIRTLPGRAGRVPIIALTADASADRAPACLAAGMNAAVTKPIDFDLLLNAIATVLPPDAPTVAVAAAAPLEPVAPGG